MDAAYDSIEIWAHSILLGHKPRKSRKALRLWARLHARSRLSRGAVATSCARGPSGSMGGFKDEFGGRHVRVRGSFGGSRPTSSFAHDSSPARLIVPPRKSRTVRSGREVRRKYRIGRPCAARSAARSLIRPGRGSRAGAIKIAPITVRRRTARSARPWVFLLRSRASGSESCCKAATRVSDSIFAHGITSGSSIRFSEVDHPVIIATTLGSSGGRQRAAARHADASRYQ